MAIKRSAGKRNKRKKGGRKRKSFGKGAKLFFAVLGITVLVCLLYGSLQKITQQLVMAKTMDVRVDLESDGNGTKTGPFKEPWGVASDDAGNFYVSEFSGHRVRKFDSSGNELFSFGEMGKDKGQFNQPSGIYVNKQGMIFVCDTFNHRIQKFDAEGNFLKEWSRSFNGPRGISGDGSRVFVVDTGNHKVQVFDEEGNFIKEWGNYGKENGNFREPEGCVVDPAGFLYVVDSDNTRIQKFNLDGKFMAAFKVSTWKGKNDEMPYLALGPGCLYTTNASQQWVLKLANTGGSLEAIYKRPGKGQGFPGAAGIAADNQGRLIVAERGQNRVVRLIPSSASASR